MKIFPIVTRIISVLATVSTAVFLFLLLTSALLPLKFSLPITIIAAFIASAANYLTFRKSTSNRRQVASLILSALLLLATIPLSLKLAETKNFLDINFPTTETVTSDASSITDQPFLVYLQGIDTRSGTMPEKSLADVNIVAAVDPTHYKLLLIAIPRDAYVHLHGTPETALNDKLTHAGSIGGLDLSKSTIEDLLGAEIPYHLRVNFNFVEGLVNAIGGINLYSDQFASFTCWTNSNCTFAPGDNYVYGDCALAFARERKAYESGDRHRGENQEQVISRVLAKTASSSTLLSNYSEILAALSGTFQTNFTSADVTTLIRQQLDTLSSWTVETYNIDGLGDTTYTYSYPSQPLYVMHLSPDSLQAAREKLQNFIK